MKLAETYLKRETATSDNHTVVLKTDESDSKEILALKTELVEFKATQTTVTTTQGQGSARRLQYKHHHDGGDHTTDKATFDVYKTFRNRHPGRPCRKEVDKKTRASSPSRE